MAKRSYLWLLTGLAVVGLTADQLTKYRVFRWLHNDRREAAGGRFEAWTMAADWYGPGEMRLRGGRYDVLPGWFGLVAEYKQDPRTGEDIPPCDCWMNGLQTWSAPHLPHVNIGALFGLGTEYPDVSNKVFAAVSVFAAVGIVGWAGWRGRRADGWIAAALGLVLGGTVGNLYDRVVFGGVRDFLYFYKINWPVFNVADCCLVCGAAMLVVHALFLHRKDQPATAAPDATAPAPVPTVVPPN